MQHEIPSWEFNQKGLITRSLPLMMKIFYRFSDSIVCVSKGLQNEMLDLLGKVNNNKIKLIYNLNSITNMKIKPSSEIQKKELKNKKYQNTYCG